MSGVRASQYSETLITIQEVRHLAGILPSTLDVDIHRDDGRFWIVRLRMGEKQYVLSTVRGAVRRWRQLDPILDFLCAHHGDFRRVCIHPPLSARSTVLPAESAFMLQWVAPDSHSAAGA